MTELLENPLIPMAAVTGRPDREFIRWFMGEYRRVGITQFLVYPRSGCEVEYLSEEWFEVIQNVIDTAQELDFTSLWLYDEFNWPSGQAGGRVMAQSPDFALQCLSAKYNPSTGEVTFETLSFPKYPNLLNPKAVEFFLQSTHEEYFRRFGKHFGTLIKGIFSDEPSFGYFWPHQATNTTTEVRLAWYPELEDEYLARTGRDLKEDLCRHFTGQKTNAFLDNCNALAGKRFRETYLDRVRSWCKTHGLLMTGHLMEEGTVHAARYNGDPLLAISGFSLPGMDEIQTVCNLQDAEWQTLGTVAYGIQQHGNGGLAELFALGPSTLPPAHYRQMLWLTALFGIDHYLMAVSQFRAEGNIHKTFWYNPTSPAQTWFAHYDQLGETARQASAVAKKELLPEVEIRYAPHSPVQKELLRKLVREQRPWRFLRSEDTPSPDAFAVIRQNADGTMTDEVTGENFWDADQLIHWMRLHYCQRSRVFSHDDVLAEDVLVHTYRDGTCVVLDLREPTAKARCLLLKRVETDGCTKFTLEAAGVAAFDSAGDRLTPDVHASTNAWELPRETWTLVELDRPNHLCPEFDAQNRLCLEVAPNIPQPRILLRNYGTAAEVLLDGMPLMPDETSGTGLPQGVAELYREAKNARIASSNKTTEEYSLELSTNDKNYPFLPSIVLQGYFGVWCIEPGKMAIASLPSTVSNGDLTKQGLCNYAGKVTLSRQVEVPVDAASLQLDTGGHCVTVTLAGQNLGTRCWNPFAWNIPEELRGHTALLEVTLEFPVGYLFGQERLSEKTWTTPHCIRAPGIYHATWGTMSAN